jgi:hypothetical protein
MYKVMFVMLSCVAAALIPSSATAQVGVDGTTVRPNAGRGR